MKKSILTGIMMLTTSPLFAATTERTDNSMFLVYAFLGMCGLIIFLQMLPIFGMIFGMIRGFKKEVHNEKLN